MQINIPKIVKRLELAEYAAEFGEAYLEVWVNPPVGLLEKLKGSIQRVAQMDAPKTKEEIGALEKAIEEVLAEQLGIYAELLSQGSEGTRLSAEELRKMVENTVETDPLFWSWVKNHVITLVNEHRFNAKKG